MANKGGGIRKSSGSDQNGFSDQNQTVAPSCTDEDSASDSDTAVQAAVKAKLDREVTLPRPHGMFEEQHWLSMYGTDSEQHENFIRKQPRPTGIKPEVLRAPQPPRYQVVTDGVVSDGDYSDDSLFAREME